MVRVDSFAPEQLAAVTGDTQPAGPSVTFRIVGIVRRPLDLGGRGATGGVVVPTRAFVEKYSDRIGSFTGTILRVRTAHGQSDVPGVVAAARRIWGKAGKAGTAGGQYEFSTTSLAIEGEGAQHAVDVMTAGLWILAGVAAAAGLVALGSRSRATSLPPRSTRTRSARIGVTARRGVGRGDGDRGARSRSRARRRRSSPRCSRRRCSPWVWRARPSPTPASMSTAVDPRPRVRRRRGRW